MWLLDWAETAAIAPTSLSIESTRSPFGFLLQSVAGNPFPAPLPQPGQAGVIPTEEFSQVQACPFPTAPESPSIAFLTSRP